MEWIRQIYQLARTMMPDNNPTINPLPSCRTCPICYEPSKPHSVYCPICYRIVNNKHDQKARVATMIRNRRADGIHCEYSGALLDLTDPGDPFYIAFDHRIPGNRGDIVASAFIVNESKCAMTHIEFPIVVHETVHHWDTGEPFRKDIVPFAYWGRRKHALKATNARLVNMALGPRLLDAGLLRPATGGNLCPVCERYATLGRHKYCPRCAKLVNVTPSADLEGVAAALHRAYKYELDEFIDYHLGAVLDLYDWTSPFYLCMDHLTPGKFNDIVATSNVANIMKKDTDEDEWHAYFRMLDAAMQGGTFDKTKLEFKYWKSYGRTVA